MPMSIDACNFMPKKDARRKTGNPFTNLPPSPSGQEETLAAAASSPSPFQVKLAFANVLYEGQEKLLSL